MKSSILLSFLTHFLSMVERQSQSSSDGGSDSDASRAPGACLKLRFENLLLLEQVLGHRSPINGREKMWCL